MASAKLKQAVELARWQGIARPKDLAARGLPPEYLWQGYQRGELTRLGRGLYGSPQHQLTEQHSLAAVAKRAPRGVICLLSALQFHQLTTQAPFEVWLAIDHKARAPRGLEWPLRLARFSGAALSEGVEEHVIEAVTVKIYSPAKTVADCFKYRHKIGLDVALEALRDCLRQKRAKVDDIWRYAEICRVARVMQPYLEAVL